MRGHLPQKIEVVILIRDFRRIAEGHAEPATLSVVSRILQLQRGHAVGKEPRGRAVVAGSNRKAVNLPVFDGLVDLAVEDCEIETGIRRSRRGLNVFPQEADKYTGEARILPCRIQRRAAQSSVAEHLRPGDTARRNAAGAGAAHRNDRESAVDWAE